MKFISRHIVKLKVFFILGVVYFMSGTHTHIYASKQAGTHDRETIMLRHDIASFAKEKEKKEKKKIQNNNGIENRCDDGDGDGDDRQR